MTHQWYTWLWLEMEFYKNLSKISVDYDILINFFQYTCSMTIYIYKKNFENTCLSHRYGISDKPDPVSKLEVHKNI